MSVFSTVAVAQGGTMLSFGDIAKAIDNCEKLLTQAAELDAAGGDKALIIKLLRAARQSSKEITGDNFGAELDLDIKGDEDSYLWYWNVFRLYDYII